MTSASVFTPRALLARLSARSSTKKDLRFNFALNAIVTSKKIPQTYAYIIEGRGILIKVVLAALGWISR